MVSRECSIDVRSIGSRRSPQVRRFPLEEPVLTVKEANALGRAIAEFSGKEQRCMHGDDAASGPYPPLAGTATKSLDKVLEAEPASRWMVQWGSLRLDKAQHKELVAAAETLSRTASEPVQEAQIVMLAQIKAGGDIPFRGPVTPAPHGTSAEALLDLNKHPPPENGMHKLGNLHVPVDEFPAFAAAQKAMCEKNSEALDLLYLSLIHI